MVPFLAGTCAHYGKPVASAKSSWWPRSQPLQIKEDSLLPWELVREGTITSCIRWKSVSLFSIYVQGAAGGGRLTSLTGDAVPSRWLPSRKLIGFPISSLLAETKSKYTAFAGPMQFVDGSTWSSWSCYHENSNITNMPSDLVTVHG